MPSKPSPSRPRGAPRGNRNALKHGIYSRHISVEETPAVDAMPADRNDDELALARARVAACLEKQRTAPPEDWLYYERAISYYLAAISRFIHNNAVLGQDKKTSVVTVLEMIRQVNEVSHVA